MGSEFDRSWAAILPDLLTITAAAQLAAARSGSSFVSALLEETGQPNVPEARVLADAFSGVSADGRSLAGLLRGAVVHAKDATVPGVPYSEALDVGGSWLDGLVQTSVADAGRGAIQAEVAVRPEMGWVRQVVSDCCGRCAILAGRWYRYDAGFARHPRCRCFGVPATRSEAGRLGSSPRELFSRGMVRGLTRDQSARIDAGEDPAKVINASRDMWRARVLEQRAADTVASNVEVLRPGIEDLMKHLSSRVEALNAMRTYGYAA